MTRAALVLWRLRRRAGRPVIWWSWGVRALGLAALVSAWLLGGFVRALPPLAVEAEVAAAIVPGLLLLFAGVAAALVGAASTAGSLWREARAEASQLLALPIRPIDLAWTRLLEALCDGWRAGGWIALLLLSAAAGAWGIGPVLPWGGPLLLAGALDVTIGTVLGAHVVLLLGHLVPPRRREPVFLVLLVGAIAGAAFLAANPSAWLNPAQLGSPGLALRLGLAPMRAAFRLYRLLSTLRPEAVVYAVGLASAAALLLWFGARSWAALLRRDLRAEARPRSGEGRKRPVVHEGATQRRRGAGTAGAAARSRGRFEAFRPGSIPERAVWRRDLRLLVRSTTFRMRALLLPATLLVLCATRLPQAWPLFLLYFAPFELVRDGLLRSLEVDRGDSLHLRTLVPSLRRYLGWRLLVAFAASLVICVPVLGVVTVWHQGFRAEVGRIALRFGLLVVSAWLASVAGLVEASLTGRRRAAMTDAELGAASGLLSTALGLAGAGACLWIDRAAAAGGRGDGAVAFEAGAVPAGILLLVGIATSPLLVGAAARAWERWSES